MPLSFASTPCKLQNIRYVESEEIAPGQLEITYSHIDESGRPTTVDYNHLVEGPPAIDGYCCNNCGAELPYWADVVDHLAEDDDDDSDTPTEKFGFGFGVL